MIKANALTTHYAVTRCYIVSDNSLTTLGCSPFDKDDCSGSQADVGGGEVCNCKTDLCNGVESVMTSSLGHVIVTVALVIGVLIGHGL